jgi:hypothetical protein
MIRTITAIAIAGASFAAPAVASEQNPAIAKAACVREAIHAGTDFLLNAPQSTAPTEKDRLADGRRVLDQTSRIKTEGVQKCITAEEAEHIGWFEYWHTVHDGKFDACGFRTTSAVELRKEDRGYSDTDLLNGATWQTSLDGMNGSEALNAKHPFFRGQDRARQYAKANNLSRGSRIVCEEIFRDFGPRGERFAGLVTKGDSSA